MYIASVRKSTSGQTTETGPKSAVLSFSAQSFFRLHSGDISRDLFPKVSVKRKFYMASRALDRESFLQIRDREFIFLSAKRARDRQSSIRQYVLQFITKGSVSDSFMLSFKSFAQKSESVSLSGIGG
jgi:hypothetical protein